MKILSLVLILICATPVLAQITPEEFRAILKEEITASENRMRAEFQAIVKETAAESENRMRAEFQAIVKETAAELEKDMREYVKLNFEKLEIQMVEFDKRLGVFDKRLDDLSKSVGFISVIVQVLFAFVALAIGLPQIVNTFRNRNYRTQQDSSPKDPSPNSPKAEETLET